MLRKIFGVVAVLIFAGCPASPPIAELDAGSTGVSDGGSDGGSAFAASAKGQVRFKRNQRLTTEIAKSLGLPLALVCNELGLYPCTTTVHHLALGGVDPYAIGVYEPLPFTGLTSPIVVDRVALSACTQRVTTDLSTPAAAFLFKGISVDASGRLTEVDGAAVRAALDHLYQRIVLRPVTDAEVGHLKKMYADVVATQKPEAAKMWMILSCFAVLTSVESVFY